MSRDGRGLRVGPMNELPNDLTPAPHPSPDVSRALSARLAAFLVLIATGVTAQPTGLGLSPVRAAKFGNENLVFFVPETDDAFGWALAAGDFDGNGVDDLATGLPGDNGYVGDELDNAGMVVIRNGVARTGLAGGTASTVISQYLPGYPYPPHVNAYFGNALATGNFDNDGYDDLIVTSPHEGANVFAHYGTASGIDVTADDTFFAQTAAAGDFNGDGFDDLAVGYPGFVCPSPSTVYGGWVAIYAGTATGVHYVNGMLLQQGVGGLPDTCEAGDAFGAFLAAGDFNGDGEDDLAIGSPGEDGTGAVVLLLGSPTGLIRATAAILRQTDLPGGATFEAGDRFAESLAIGDFDGDGYDDLAIGIPGETVADVPPIVDAGQVSVIFGSGGGGVFDFAKTKHRFGDVEQGEFGLALAAGDFDRDGNDDLAVGVPWGLGPTFQVQGNVWIYLGAPAVVGPFGRYRGLTPGQLGVIPPGMQTGMEWGRALAVGDFDDDGHDDLAVGAPRFFSGGLPGVGVVSVLYGSLFSDGFETQSTASWIAGP